MGKVICRNCKWWAEFGLVDDEDKDSVVEGFCHKYAPRIVEGMLFCAHDDISGETDCTKQEFPDNWNNQDAVWPKTLDFWWCGEFKSKE